jgi:renal tumor antigen
MVFELMDINLYDLISGRRDHLDRELVRSLGYQMFLALDHMHRNGIFHSKFFIHLFNGEEKNVDLRQYKR